MGTAVYPQDTGYHLQPPPGPCHLIIFKGLRMLQGIWPGTVLSGENCVLCALLVAELYLEPHLCTSCLSYTVEGLYPLLPSPSILGFLLSP